ncbi:DUF4142 domain-containing protein [Sphingobacterium sp.]|uniref:DUF4142 domain-containing protein n=1 Tax=Sphingobacterium sp. TaxID=341027 RepID=UPI0028979271|nr:DUF4142 domain-containing protein [Sphingobacterium sp.]
MLIASIALAKSQNAQSIQYAQMIADDHTAAGNELATCPLHLMRHLQLAKASHPN